MQCYRSHRGYPSLWFLFFIAMVCFISSCSTQRTSYYFKSLRRDTTIATFVNKDIDLKIRKGDRLSIQVSSLNKDQDALYNSSYNGVGSVAGGAVLGDLTTGAVAPVEGPSGYPVDSSGNILIHTFGVVHVEGMTLKELGSKLQNDLLPYLKEPIVYVNFANHKITLLGVSKPQVLEMPEEPLTLLDALALGGDIVNTVEVKNVLIIRDSLNTKKFKHINMEDGTFINSPWYYLQPNDIVYVQPNAQKLDQDERRLETQQTITIISSVLTILIVILDRIN